MRAAPPSCAALDTRCNYYAVRIVGLRTINAATINAAIKTIIYSRSDQTDRRCFIKPAAGRLTDVIRERLSAAAGCCQKQAPGVARQFLSSGTNVDPYGSELFIARQ